MRALSQLLEEVGHQGVLPWTAIALELHNYQYNGPDTTLNKYRNRQEAAIDVKLLIKELANRIENLKPGVKWSNELEKALMGLRRGLGY